MLAHRSLRKGLLLAIVASGILAPSVARCEEARRTERWPVGIGGTAYELRLRRGTPEAVEVNTVFPVLSYTGRSAEGRWLAYTTLAAVDASASSGRRSVTRAEADSKAVADLVPSGDLIVERRGKTRRINRDGHFVITAAWSPTGDSRIAYTFSSGDAFGVALADVVSGEVEVVRPSGVVADYLSWAPAGGGLDVYFEGAPLMTEQKYPVPQVEEHRLPVGPAAAVRQAAAFQLPRLISRLAHWSPNADAQPFRSEMAGGYAVEGDNVLGASRLALLGPDGTQVTAVEAQRLVAVLPTGVAYKELTENGVLLRYLSKRGEVSTLVEAAPVSYKLPMGKSFSPDLTCTQVGASYSTKCNVSSHTGNLSYAYDFQAVVGNEAILAAAAGSVVYVHTSCTCNAIDKTGCVDYSASCASNGGWGNVIILSHADGTYTKYTHLRHTSISVWNGKSVTVGCKMAMEGHTGNTCCTKNGCGDHLHFQRQGTSGLNAASTSINFSDVTNPLSCTTYNTGNTKVSC